MHLESIINHIEPLKRFVSKRERWGHVRWTPAKIEVEPPANERPTISGCGKKRPGSDRLA
jgi:hypothetical protein